MRESLRSFFGLLYFYAMAYVVRAPSSIPLLMLRMGIVVALLILVGGRSYALYALSGALVALSFGAGLSQFSVDVNALRVSGYQGLLLTAPLNPALFAIGTALGMSLPSFIGLTVFLIPWYLVCRPGLVGIVELAIVLSVTWLIGLSIGFLLTLAVKSPHILFNITDTIYALLVYLAPVYYPMRLVPHIVRPLALFSPAADASIVVREIALRGHVVSAGHLCALVVASASLLLLIARLSKWRE